MLRRPLLLHKCDLTLSHCTLQVLWLWQLVIFACMEPIQWRRPTAAEVARVLQATLEVLLHAAELVRVGNGQRMNS